MSRLLELPLVRNSSFCLGKVHTLNGIYFMPLRKELIHGYSTMSLENLLSYLGKVEERILYRYLRLSFTKK